CAAAILSALDRGAFITGPPVSVGSRGSSGGIKRIIDNIKLRLTFRNKNNRARNDINQVASEMEKLPPYWRLQTERFGGRWGREVGWEAEDERPFGYELTDGKRSNWLRSRRWSQLNWSVAPCLINKSRALLTSRAGQYIVCSSFS
ncbi:hypothetical protein GWI33_009607, partial [Rhynchophorus ferrugineus]